MLDDQELYTVSSPRYQSYRENRLSQLSISKKTDIDKVYVSDVQTQRIFTEEPLPTEPAAKKVFEKPRRHKSNPQVTTPESEISDWTRTESFPAKCSSKTAVHSKNNKYLRDDGETRTRGNSVEKAVYNLGENGSGIKTRRAVQDFEQLRQQCLKSGQLFEDPEFPAVDSSISFLPCFEKPIEWKRPTGITGKPQFFVEGYSRFDVEQGGLGDCWLLAAVATLPLHSNLFKTIVPEDQSFDVDYAGIFHFRFWQYDRWVDVVIDDRLPMSNGKLWYLHSAEPREFWGALLEKAYAKLQGCYDALNGGTASDAMEELTGGVREMYETAENPPTSFSVLLQAYESNSLMTCAIDADPHKETKTPEGLLRGHAYSITGVKYVENARKTEKIQLLRLRNPWGIEDEWNGPWSDNSSKWKDIASHDKEELGLISDVDGEFWMQFEDFKKYFHRLMICMLNPNSLTEDDLKAGKKKWEMRVFKNEWVRGATAGGYRTFPKTFWHNPQYRITLNYADEGDDKCTVIIALMQKKRRVRRKIHLLHTSFVIYHVARPESLPKPFDNHFFKNKMPVGESSTPIRLRQVSGRFKLLPGTYCIVPCTSKPNADGEFVLRIFSEKPIAIEEYDNEVGIEEVDNRIRDEPEPQCIDEKIRKIFKRPDEKDWEFGWVEFKNILDRVMKDDLPASTRRTQPPDTRRQGCSIVDTFNSLLCIGCCDKKYNNSVVTRKQGFSPHVCRRMVAMMNVEHCAKLGYYEFRELQRNVKKWTAVFKEYEKDGSGRLKAFQLWHALNSAGYRLNNRILNILAHRYATADGSIMFDDYIMCIVHLKTIIDCGLDLEATGLLV